MPHSALILYRFKHFTTPLRTSRGEESRSFSVLQTAKDSGNVVEYQSRKNQNPIRRNELQQPSPAFCCDRDKPRWGRVAISGE